MTAPELLPCPFCKDDVDARDGEHVWHPHQSRCILSHCVLPIAAWNTRTPDPLLVEALEALRDIAVMGSDPSPEVMQAIGRNAVQIARATLAKADRKQNGEA